MTGTAPARWSAVSPRLTGSGVRFTAAITEEVIAGTYVPGWDYFDADTGALGLYGFMEGQELTTRCG